jgi:23S rRNA (adenine(2503)-C(2))-methyltransferase
MAKKRRLSPQSVYDEAAVQAAFAEAGIKDVHVATLYKHLTRFPDAAWDSIPAGFPKAAVSVLEKDFVRTTSKVVEAQHSSDGETSKLLLELQDGLTVEAVIMHYDTSDIVQAGDEADSMISTGGSRATLCVSSEVGCQMGCTFCATGTMGLKGDLTAGEIVEQLVHARTLAPIRNVVFMGMGEPLNNYNAVRPAVSMMTDGRYFGLRRSAVTVSTVGVIPRILQLADDLPGVSLALSLHAPNQELRKSIVPSAAAYKLDKLMAAIETYQQRTRQKVFLEYVMLRGVNDNPEQAHELGALLRGRNVVQNLIPWNPIYSPTISFEAPGPERTLEFQRILRQEYGVPTTIRREKGQDISGACGQLVVETSQRCGGGGGGAAALDRPLTDIEEVGKRRTLVPAV